MKNRSVFAGLLVVVTSLLGVMSTPAMGGIVIGFDPVSPTVLVGGFVDVDIVISGLGDGIPDSVSVFDIDVLFDDSLVGFDSIEYGALGVFDLDLYDLGSVTDTVPFGGGVNLFELSFDLPGELDDDQLPSFTLATITFKGLALGISPLSIVISELGDSLGDPLSATTDDGEMTVIPAPGAVLLAMMGFGLVGWVRKRRMA